MWPSPSCGSRPNCARREVEVFDDRLDDDGVAGLTGAVAGGDDLYAGLPRHRCRARLGAVWSRSRRRRPAPAPATATVAASAARLAVLLRIGAGTLRATSRTPCGERATAILGAGARPRPAAPRRAGAPTWPATSTPSPAPGPARAPSAAATTSPARRCPSGWSSGAPTRPPSAPHSRRLRPPRQPPHGLQPHPPQRRRLRPLRRLPLPADDRADRLLAGAAGGRPRRRVPARLLPRRGGAPARASTRSGSTPPAAPASTPR